MASENNQLTRFIIRLSGIIALLVGLSLPIGYSLVAYNNLSESLLFKAQLKSNGQSELITIMPDTWMFAENRIHGILKREPVILDNEQVQIFDGQGDLVTSTGTPESGPKIQRSYPLYDIDRIVGKVVITASLKSIIINTAEVALIGLLLGALVLLTMRLIPIRQLRRISDELYEEKERALITLHSISDVVLRTDLEARLVFINSAGEKMIGRSLDEIQGQRISDILHFIDYSTGDTITSALMKALHSQTEASCDGQCSLDIGNGLKIAIEERAAPIFNRRGKLSGGVLCLRDVSITRDYLERRSWEASHDSMTGLLNRRAFEQCVAKAIDKVHGNEQHYVLCFMDLDRFKVVNDSCGHAAGDELLIQITRMMRSKVRENDILARIGGDEFGLLLEGCNVTQGKVIANQLLDAVEDFQFVWQKQVHTVGMSIGLTTISSESHKINEVLSEADSACYWAKEHGRHQVCVFTASDIDLAARRTETSWVGRIVSALKDKRFVLYHQVYRTLSIDVGMRLHMEVLIRLVDEEGAIILPANFLPAAERYDLIQEIDRWVINEVFAGFHLLAATHSNTALMVNINLSGASINSKNLLPFIKAKITEFNVDPQSICFEVTETVAVNNISTAIEFINECKKIGIKFALDDFGTGTSSFAYLKNLPVDYLKIDGSFVQHIESDAVDREMAGTINRIGHLMGKVTIAEFAESEPIVDILHEMGVDFAQGYGVCLPTPLFPTNEDD